MSVSSVPLGRLSGQARQVDVARAASALARAVLVAIAAVFYGIGWSARRLTAAVVAASVVVAFAVTWCGAAVRVGWTDAGS